MDYDLTPHGCTVSTGTEPERPDARIVAELRLIRDRLEWLAIFAGSGLLVLVVMVWGVA